MVLKGYPQSFVHAKTKPNFDHNQTERHWGNLVGAWLLLSVFKSVFNLMD